MKAVYTIGEPYPNDKNRGHTNENLEVDASTGFVAYRCYGRYRMRQ
jgi:hypothetical protein